MLGMQGCVVHMRAALMLLPHLHRMAALCDQPAFIPEPKLRSSRVW